MGGVRWSKTRTPGVYRRDGVRGRHYRHVYRDQSGRQIACSACQTLDAAEKHQARMKTDRPEDVAAGRITLRAVYDEMVAAHEADGEPYAQASLDLYESVWRHLASLADVDLGKITPIRIDAVLGAIDAPAMRQKARRVLTTTFTYAIHKRYLSSSPVRVERKRTTRSAKMRQAAASGRNLRIMTADELSRLLVQMPERWRGMVELMVYCGLRPGEAVSLRVGKFDPMQRTLLIDTALTGFTKTGEPRTLVLPDVVVEILTEHLARFSDPTDPDAPMFAKEDGTAITTKPSYDAWSRNHFRPAAKRADVNHGLSPNDCRHYAASFAIGHGADVFSVQRMLGHAKPSITLDIYAKEWETSAETLARNLDEPIRQARAQHPEDAKVVRLG